MSQGQRQPFAWSAGIGERQEEMRAEDSEDWIPWGLLDQNSDCTLAGRIGSK